MIRVLGDKFSSSSSDDDDTKTPVNTKVINPDVRYGHFTKEQKNHAVKFFDENGGVYSWNRKLVDQYIVDSAKQFKDLPEPWTFSKLQLMYSGAKNMLKKRKHADDKKAIQHKRQKTEQKEKPIPPPPPPSPSVGPSSLSAGNLPSFPNPNPCTAAPATPMQQANSELQNMRDRLAEMQRSNQSAAETASARLSKIEFEESNLKTRTTDLERYEQIKEHTRKSFETLHAQLREELKAAANQKAKIDKLLENMNEREAEIKRRNEELEKRNAALGVPMFPLSGTTS